MCTTAAAAAGCAASYGLLAALLASKTRPDPGGEVRTVITADGWRLGMREYSPVGESKGTVYLQHGLGSVPATFDLHPHGPSLARWLAQRGWRVFTGALRGRPPSEGTAEGRRPSWNLSDYLLRDVPALGRAVSQLAGERFHFIGHSLGGILGLAYAAREGAQTLSSVTTLASAFHYGVGSSAFARGKGLRPLLGLLSTVPTRLWHRLYAPLTASWLLPDAFMYNRSNMRAGAVLAFHAHSVADITTAELRELSTTFSGPGILCEELGVRLPELAAEMKTPWLSVVGPADLQCPPDTAEWTYERIERAPKRKIVCSREEGFAHDYGHVDLVVGHKAEEELWPKLEEFLTNPKGAKL